MQTYLALLRGINVGGNSIIKMTDLKECFEQQGFSNVKTYIQSGNVIFKSTQTDQSLLEKNIEAALEKRFGYASKVVIRSAEQLNKVIRNIPKNWNQADKTKKYNVIFLRSSVDKSDILDGLKPKADIEELFYFPGVLLWAANTSDLTKTSMVKLSSNAIYKEVTVRNLNTTLKLYEIIQQY